jgi:hypothetical protein
MDIGHVGDWLDTLDYWGDELTRNQQRRNTWLAKFMLTNGAAPAPIVVATNALGCEHPRGGAMKNLQLVEGHIRLAYLRSMIRHGHPKLQADHTIWTLELPGEWLDRAPRHDPRAVHRPSITHKLLPGFSSEGPKK